MTTMSNYDRAADLAGRGFGDKAQAYATLAVADTIQELTKAVKANAPKDTVVRVINGETSWWDPTNVNTPKPAGDDGS